MSGEHKPQNGDQPEMDEWRREIREFGNNVRTRLKSLMAEDAAARPPTAASPSAEQATPQPVGEATDEVPVGAGRIEQLKQDLTRRLERRRD